MRLLLENPNGKFRRFVSESRKLLQTELEVLGGGVVHVVSPGESYAEAIERVVEMKADAANAAKKNGVKR